MKLSENFTLAEMLRSASASRMGLKEQFDPPEKVIGNLKELCEHVLQPLREQYGKPIFVSSGYRCPKLNKSVGGSKTSQHMTGEAADIQAIGKMTNKQLFDFIIRAKLPFDQLIIEFEDEFGEPGWIHVSYSSERQRGKILRAYKDQNGKTKYLQIN